MKNALYILRIEHPIPDFTSWKAAFDSDPVDRQGSGVRRYRILRSHSDPNYVMIDLEFGSAAEAESLLNAMREIWSNAGARVSSEQRACIAELVEDTTY